MLWAKTLSFPQRRKEAKEGFSLQENLIKSITFISLQIPRDGRIKEFTGHLKAVSAKAIVRANSRFVFPETDKGHQVWQESFRDVALWSGWMIWQKINYIHANPVKAGLALQISEA